MFYYAPANAEPNTTITYMYECISIGSTSLIDITLLRLYINGQSNVYKWWASKHRWEFMEFGETQRGHEILLKMTRDCIVMSIPLILNIIDTTWSGVVYRALEAKGISKLTRTVFNIMSSVIRFIDIGSFVIASYFMYPFGYTHYRKYCNPCNTAAYKCCEKYHHTQIHTGNDRYRKLNDLDERS